MAATRQSFNCSSSCGTWATVAAGLVDMQPASTTRTSVEHVDSSAAASPRMGMGWTEPGMILRGSSAGAACPSNTDDVIWMSPGVRQDSRAPATLQAYNHGMARVDHMRYGPAVVDVVCFSFHGGRGCVKYPHNIISGTHVPIQNLCRRTSHGHVSHARVIYTAQHHDTHRLRRSAHHIGLLRRRVQPGCNSGATAAFRLHVPAAATFPLAVHPSIHPPASSVRPLLVLIRSSTGANSLPSDWASSPGRPEAAGPAAGEVLPAGRYSCSPCVRGSLHHVVRGRHATSGQYCVRDISSGQGADGAAAAPHRTLPAGLCAISFAQQAKATPMKRYSTCGVVLFALPGNGSRGAAS